MEAFQSIDLYCSSNAAGETGGGGGVEDTY